MDCRSVVELEVALTTGIGEPKGSCWPEPQMPGAVSRGINLVESHRAFAEDRKDGESFAVVAQEVEGSDLLRASIRQSSSTYGVAEQVSGISTQVGNRSGLPNIMGGLRASV
jgi:hypothetical protein